MCARSECKIKGKEVNVHLGYFGGSITIDEKEFSVDYSDRDTTMTEKEMFDDINETYSKEEVIQMLLDIIKNGEED